jgi:dihydroorotate dehydrogenase
VTPRPQPGNPRPRLFRLPAEQALINRLGFNNAGVEAFARNLASARPRFRGVLGANIGKNFDTPIERAADDYIACQRAVCPHADYVAVNISSPNTKNLRDLQSPEALGALLRALDRERSALADRHGRRTPLAVKIAPDLDDGQIAAIARLLVEHRIDAVIATNTTLSREGVAGHPLAGEAGGLSGRPLRARSTEVLRKLARRLDGSVPVIAAGGILSGEDAREKIAAGATLVQLYTGLVYRGPALVAEVARALRSAPVAASPPSAIAAGRTRRH